MQSLNPATDFGESGSSTRVRVEAIVESLEVVLELGGTENKVRGKGYFRAPLVLPEISGVRFHSFDAEILSESAQDTAAPQSADQSSTGPAPVGALLISHSVEEANEYAYAKLVLRLDQEAWNTLVEKTNTAAQIHLDLTLEPKVKQHGWRDFLSVYLNSRPELSVNGGLESSQRAISIRQRELKEYLRSNYIEGGQLKRVAEELAETAARATNPPDPRNYARIIGNLFCDLQIAMRLEKPAPGAQFGSMWGLNPKGFSELLSGMSRYEANVLKKNYDTVWWKYNLLLLVNGGENKYGAKADGFEPNAELLEEVAVKYLELPAGYSKTFEWILIDALVYAECVAYARTILSDKKFLGVTVPADLKGLNSNKAWGTLFKNTIWRGLIEGLETQFLAHHNRIRK